MQSVCLAHRKMGRVKYKTLITREGGGGERMSVCMLKGCNLVQLNGFYSVCNSIAVIHDYCI